MGDPPPGHRWSYAGMHHKWLSDSMVDEAELVFVGYGGGPAKAAAAPSQMALMVLPEVVSRSLKQPKIQGYAALPGTGPDGETCGTCVSLTVRALTKRYHKCLKTIDRWTAGRGSDVRVKDRACRVWSAKS